MKQGIKGRVRARWYGIAAGAMLVVLPSAGNAAAARATWSGTPVTVADLNGSSMVTPKIVSDGAGGTIVAWADFRNGVDTDVYAQKLDSNGTPLWTPGGVPVCTAAGYQNGVDVAPDGAGGAVVVWSDERNGLPRGADIYYRRVLSNGTLAPVITGSGILCGADNTQLNPRIVRAPGPAGDALVIWTDARDGGSDIYGQKISQGIQAGWGDPTDSLGVPLLLSPYYEDLPQMIADGQGGAIFAWTHEVTYGSYNVYAQRINNSGATQWGTDGLQVSQQAWVAGGGYPSFTLVPDATGGAFISWDRYNQADTLGLDVRAQLVSPSGTALWGIDGITVVSGSGNQGGPLLQATSDSAAVVVWLDGNKGAYAQRYDRAGHIRWTAGGVPLPRYGPIVPLNGGDWAVNGIGSEFAVTRLTPNGQVLGPPGGTLIDALPLNAGFSSTSDTGGHDIAAYERDDGGGRDLVVQRVDPPNSGQPDTTNSYYVVQAGSVSTPTEGIAAIRLLRTCPNNDGGTALPNNVRVKIVLKNASGVPLVGVDAADMFLAFNGGTAAQGFYGAGADSIIANSTYNQSPLCPTVQQVLADAPTDANGVAYITLLGATPGQPGVATRDPYRKWGHYDSDIPVFALGTRLSGRFDSGSANGSFILRIKNVDWTQGLGTVMNQGEWVTVQDYNGIVNGIGVNNVISYWKDFNWSGSVDNADLNIILAHFNQTGNHNCVVPFDP